VVLAGRATDTAVVAAVPLMQGMPAGPTWHAAKIVECGGAVHHEPALQRGVRARSTPPASPIEPLDPTVACTPTSVAAHMLYETVNPFEMREPAGTLQVADATYVAWTTGACGWKGSRFAPAAQYTNKLEGARITGYETMSFTAIRDPHILGQIATWAALLRRMIDQRVAQTARRRLLRVDIRLYGYDAVLEDIDPSTAPPREVGVMLLVHAPDQQTATAIAKLANPLMLHLPTPDMAYLPSLAFPFSPRRPSGVRRTSSPSTTSSTWTHRWPCSGRRSAGDHYR
jgi:hypothetical protein